MSVSSTTVTVSRVTAALSGQVTITVTATDPGGLSATRTFTVTVEPLKSNRAPTAVGTIPAQTLVIGGASVTLNLSSYFSDPDSDTLIYTANISDEQPVLPEPLVKMGVSNTLQTLSISAKQAEGSGTITIKATDPDGLSATQVFTVTVEAPKLDINDDSLVNVLDLVLVAGQMGQPADDNIADINKDGVVNILDLVLVASKL